jgi:hypothetical protein
VHGRQVAGRRHRLLHHLREGRRGRGYHSESHHSWSSSAWKDSAGLSLGFAVIGGSESHSQERTHVTVSSDDIDVSFSYCTVGIKRLQSLFFTLRLLSRVLWRRLPR